MNGEEQQLTEEDLRNMSPAELLELERKNCVFCNIVSGKIPSKKVYEDDKVAAVLDINPASPGHMLLITKEHYQIMPQIPDELVVHLGETAKMLSHAALRGLYSRGTTIFVANGFLAGQKAPHFIMHIIPRDQGDNVEVKIPESGISEEENLEALKIMQERLGALVKGGGARPAKKEPELRIQERDMAREEERPEATEEKKPAESKKLVVKIKRGEKGKEKTKAAKKEPKGKAKGLDELLG